MGVNYESKSLVSHCVINYIVHLTTCYIIIFSVINYIKHLFHQIFTSELPFKQGSGESIYIVSHLDLHNFPGQ